MADNKKKIEEDRRSRFYKIILSWDYLQIIKESYEQKEGNVGLKKVKSTYGDVDEYLNTYEPLLFEEVKAQIVSGEEDEKGTHLQEVVVVDCSEVNGFYLPTVACLDENNEWVLFEESISQNDILLVSPKKFGQGKTLPLPTTYAFGVVEDRHQGRIRLRLYLSIRTIPRLSNMIPHVTENRRLYIKKICGLSTIAREYVAMHSISYLPPPFKDLILSATNVDHTSGDRAWRISTPLKEYIESNHNKSQIEAIYAGLSRKPFVLIQNSPEYDLYSFVNEVQNLCRVIGENIEGTKDGPPGTGKTQTILGLLSAILHATPARVHSKREMSADVTRKEMPFQEKCKHWNKASPWLTGINPLDMIMPIDGDDGFFPTSGSDLKPEVVNSSRKYRVRVLVCAPSNSALDEIVLRILNTGIRDEDDHAYNPKIVRVGVKPHHSIQAVSMDYLVKQKLASVVESGGDKQKQGGVAKDKSSIMASVLDEAVIVFSTLSGSALFNKLNLGFDVVIIDEAAQAVETATLIPLANGCKQVFLVGDPKQLPATVISTVAKAFGYDTSLFKRLQGAGYPVQMLKTQYRMHPEIRRFPSKEFYEETLEDGPDVELQTKRSWHNFRYFGPFCFFDIYEGKELPASDSWVNDDEVDFILTLYSNLVGRYPELKSSSRLAIISPYAYQVKRFKEKFCTTFGVEPDKVVDINTVDGFQGREKDVAIFSCVRANENKGIGFVSDFRRMNVGITRARSSVLIVGSASTLMRDDNHWKNLVESAQERNALFKVPKPYNEFFSDSNLKSVEVEVKSMEEINPEDMDVDMDMPFNVSGNAVEYADQENDWGDGNGDGDED